MEEPVEILARPRRVVDAKEPLHEIPQCIRIENEAGARHDVGLVAGLILLQQIEALMLLRQEPLRAASLTRLAYCRSKPLGLRCRSRIASAINHHNVESIQPRYPEISFLPLYVRRISQSRPFGA